MSASLTPNEPYPPASGKLTISQAASHLISVCEATSKPTALPALSQASLTATEASYTLRASPRSALSSTFNTEPSYPLAFVAPKQDFTAHYLNRAALYANPSAHLIHVSPLSPKKDLAPSNDLTPTK